MKFTLTFFFFISFYPVFATPPDSSRIVEHIKDITQLITDDKYEAALSYCQKIEQEDQLILQKYPLLKAAIYQKIGAIHYNQTNSQNNYQQANFHYQEALKIRLQKLAANDGLVIHLYYLLLHLNVAYEKDGGIIQYGKKMIKYLYAKTTTDTIRLSIAYREMGAAYARKRDFQQALQYLEQALGIFQQINDAIQIAETLNEKGRIYNYLGDYQQAIATYQQAIRIAQDLNYPSYAAIYQHNLALVYFRTNEYDIALKKLLQVFSFYEKFDLKEKKPLNMASIYGQLGVAYLNTNQSDSALHFNTESLRLRQEHLGTIYHPLLAASYDNRGDIFFKQKDYQQALNLYHQGLQSLVPNLSSDVFINPHYFIDQAVIAPRQFLILLTSKAKTFQQLAVASPQADKYLKAALQTCQALDQWIVQIRKGFKVSESSYRLQEVIIPIYELGIKLALQLHQQTQDAQYLEIAYAFCAKNKAIVLLENWQREQAKFASIPDSLQQKEQALKQNYRQVEEEIYNLNIQDPQYLLAQKKQDLFDLKLEYDQFIEQLERRYPKYKALKLAFTVPLSIADIQKQLAPKTAVIEYFVGETTIFTMLITKKGLKAYQIPKPDNFEAICQDLREAVHLSISSANKWEAKYLATSYQVYQWILEQALEDLEEQESIERLRIIPDDQLLSLSFDFLLTAETPDYHYQDNPYLLKKYALSIAYSNLLLFDKRTGGQTDRKQKDFGGFGLEYDTLTLQSLQADKVSSSASITPLPLPSADDEVAAIARLFENNHQIWLNEAATRSNFLKHATKFKILHLSMHGFIKDDNPAFSSLAFTKIDDSTDYLLQAADLEDLELQADMVVLSACHTGFGKLYRGEGMRSLARAFTYAGTPSLIANLWGAYDIEPEINILLQYYQCLKQGLPKDVALQQAKLSHLQSDDMPPSYLSPAYWSYLIAIGDMSPIHSSSCNFWIWVILGFIVLCCCFLVSNAAKSIS